jgi:acyl-coenzyme A thioesterase PaaI-like protein
MSPPSTADAVQKLADLSQRTPYIRLLGVRLELAGDEMTAILPFSDKLIGDPGLPALHGGVLGAFLELTALAQLFIMTQALRQPRPIGVTVEYLRSGRPMDTYARAQIKRIGSRIANVYAEAWQETRAAPITCLHGRFLLTSTSGPPPVGSLSVQTSPAT